MDFLIIALAGIVGTSVMIASMSLIHYLKLTNADMVGAIGSLVTENPNRVYAYGLGIHYSMGILFATAYTTLIASAPIQTPGSAMIISLLTGLAHGLMVGLVLMVEVAEHHPNAKFREAGLGVALGHVAGHVAYGASVGISLALGWKWTQTMVNEISDSLEPIAKVLEFAAIWGPLTVIPFLIATYAIYATVNSKKTATQDQNLTSNHVIPIKSSSQKNQTDSNSRKAA